MLRWISRIWTQSDGRDRQIESDLHFSKDVIISNVQALHKSTEKPLMNKFSFSLQKLP